MRIAGLSLGICSMGNDGTFEAAHAALCNDDPIALKRLLAESAPLRAAINSPAGSFDSPAILHARSCEMLDVLLGAGADLNAKSSWWAGGFGVLHSAPLDVARHAVKLGAEIDIHAAARLDLLDRACELLTADRSLVHARGGDGQLPLHFARSVQMADLLLGFGADIDARDIDHESTAAQYMLDERVPIARHLVNRGCSTDLLLAVAVDDSQVVRKHLRDSPQVIRTRVNDVWFPMSNHRAGGTIYQWTLGWHVTAHQVAKARGHEGIFRILWEHSPADVRAINAALLHDEPLLDEILKSSSPISFSERDLRLPTDLARNNDFDAVRLLAKAGLPTTTPGQHSGTPLHWAAWHGNLPMVQFLLFGRPALEDRNNEFSATPLGWAIHGSENGWHCKSGNYPGVVEALLGAGAQFSGSGGTAGVREVLRRFTERAPE